VLNTALLALLLVGIHVESPKENSWETYAPLQSVASSFSLDIVQTHSVVLAPISWAAVIGAWIWRGRAKSDWTRHGLDQGLFRLLLQMKGGETRTTILRELLIPKDRLQLAKDLCLNWTTIDYHVQVLLKHGLVQEKTAYGNVKLYELTSTGNTLLSALEEMSKRSG
jgi:predicted transcriptional regulator